MLRKLLLVYLIVLVASPVTAPFSTSDLAVIDVLHQGMDIVGAPRVVRDVAAISSLASHGVPVTNAEPIHLRTAVFFTAVGEARPLVLRL